MALRTDSVGEGERERRFVSVISIGEAAPCLQAFVLAPPRGMRTAFVGRRFCRSFQVNRARVALPDDSCQRRRGASGAGTGIAGRLQLIPPLPPSPSLPPRSPRNPRRRSRRLVPGSYAQKGIGIDRRTRCRYVHFLPIVA